ncbi:MAG: lipopolysaccharide heptosyltransferase I [Legionellales bacterium]|jgi:heptosyltransferase I|nr:lipopolysaccharide heptosyltransferase I [Legionellales bacterium]
MKILLIKMSSLGDAIHTLPAITDIASLYPNAEITWAVEPNFAAIPAMHPAITHIISTPLRNIKKNIMSKQSISTLTQIRHELNKQQYDLVIDAQGLLKSSLLSKIANGKNFGYCRKSAREAISAIFYKNKISIAKNQHAVMRTKKLCAAALKYDMPQEINYGITATNQTTDPYVILFHGTTWASKHYPQEQWLHLIKIITTAGFKVKIPWGNQVEYKRAQQLATIANTEVLPKSSLSELKDIIFNAKGAIGVDTGLTHLAAALGTPCIGLYGPTDHDLAGNLGQYQAQISTRRDCAPCQRANCCCNKNNHTTIERRNFSGSASKDPNQVPSFLCMGAITPADIWAKLQSIWEK